LIDFTVLIASKTVRYFIQPTHGTEIEEKECVLRFIKFFKYNAEKKMCSYC